MRVSEKAARDLLEAMGFDSKGSNRVRLGKRLGNPEALLAEGREPEDSENSQLLMLISKAVADGEKIIVGEDESGGEADPAPAGKKAKKKELVGAAAKGGKAKGGKGKGGRAKDAGESKGPGVIASIVEFLQGATKTKPISKQEIADRLSKRFPDRDAESMLKTVGVQVPSRISKERGVKVNSDKDGGYWIGK